MLLQVEFCEDVLDYLTQAAAPAVTEIRWRGRANRGRAIEHPGHDDLILIVYIFLEYQMDFHHSPWGVFISEISIKLIDFA